MDFCIDAMDSRFRGNDEQNGFFQRFPKRTLNPQ